MGKTKMAKGKGGGVETPKEYLGKGGHCIHCGIQAGTDPGTTDSVLEHETPASSAPQAVRVAVEKFGG